MADPLNSRTEKHNSDLLAADWLLPAHATLGSAVRLKGIEREMRRHLSWAVRKCVAAETGRITLRMPGTERAAFDDASPRISDILNDIGTLPILPRKVEDILGIPSGERRKWLKDERLSSAGTKTVKLRGRAKAVTFHIFDTKHVEDVLDGDLTQTWRDEDARTAAESRRRAAGKAATPIAQSRWGRQPFSQGSFSHALPGHADARTILARDIDGRIFFSGEACSKHDFPTAHGAYQTGIVAAEAILDRLVARTRP